MRSGFGSRRHPILGYTKMHTGIDWAAPMGTPIYAAGNGAIAVAGWESGYGKYIRVKHTNGYETAYGHMTAFARGMEPGARVRQGQVIGYVGSTGQSTGAHVHYEILVNGRFVDPMRLKLPRAPLLESPVLSGFEKSGDRASLGMMAQAPSRSPSPATRARSRMSTTAPHQSDPARSPGPAVGDVQLRFTEFVFPGTLSADRHHADQGGLTLTPWTRRDEHLRCLTSPSDP
jgi:hypothetical protein